MATFGTCLTSAISCHTCSPYTEETPQNIACSKTCEKTPQTVALLPDWRLSAPSRLLSRSLGLASTARPGRHGSVRFSWVQKPRKETDVASSRPVLCACRRAAVLRRGGAAREQESSPELPGAGARRRERSGAPAARLVNRCGWPVPCIRRSAGKGCPEVWGSRGRVRFGWRRQRVLQPEIASSWARRFCTCQRRAGCRAPTPASLGRCSCVCDAGSCRVLRLPVYFHSEELLNEAGVGVINK